MRKKDARTGKTLTFLAWLHPLLCLLLLRVQCSEGAMQLFCTKLQHVDGKLCMLRDQVVSP